RRAVPRGRPRGTRSARRAAAAGESRRRRPSRRVPAAGGESRLALGGSSGRLAVAGERRGNRAGERSDREGLAEQLIAAEVVGFTLADIAGDEQHGEIAAA